MEESLALLPLRPQAPIKISSAQNVRLISNHYFVGFQKNLVITQFSLDTEPKIPDDSIDQLRELIKILRPELKNKIGFICHKGKIIWGSKYYEKTLSFTSKIKSESYQVILKHVKTFHQTDLGKLDGDSRKKIAQIYSIAVKQNLNAMKLKEIMKGKYFKLDPPQKEIFILKDRDLKLLRTFEMRIVPLSIGMTLQIDVGSRALRTQSFLQTCQNMSKDAIRNFIGSTVQCNYGNRNSYKITNILFNKTPKDIFYHDKISQEIDYQTYYRKQYGIKIIQSNQFLLQVVLFKRVEIKDGKQIKKLIYGHLIPELVHLVGLPDEFKNDFNLRKTMSQFTQLSPDQRHSLSYQIINDFNQKNQLTTIGKNLQIDGLILPQAAVYAGKQKVKISDGKFNLSQFKDQMKLQKFRWLLVLSQNKYQKQEAYDIYEKFKDSQGAYYGTSIGEPNALYLRQSSKFLQDWKKKIRQAFKKEQHIIVVVIIFKREYDVYSQLKEFLINELKVPSQILVREKINKNNYRSIFSKIICQMHAKIGKVPWVVARQHPFLQKKKVACGAFSISKNRNGRLTLAFVGSFTDNLAQTLSITHANLSSQKITQALYTQIYVNWLKKYRLQNKYFPEFLMIYREGLSDQQVKIDGEKEVKGLQEAVKRAQLKFPNFKPSIVYIVVNKKIHCKFYSKPQNSGKFMPKLENPSPGTIVFDPLSIDNAYDFHLAAQQKVMQGTCTPCHYRIAYLNCQDLIPQEAIALFTYQQCHNYFNWFGTVRVPGYLQNANKLSQLIGEHLTTNVVVSDLTTTPFYL